MSLDQTKANLSLSQQEQAQQKDEATTGVVTSEDYEDFESTSEQPARRKSKRVVPPTPLAGSKENLMSTKQKADHAAKLARETAAGNVVT